MAKHRSGVGRRFWEECIFRPEHVNKVLPYRRGFKTRLPFSLQFKLLSFLSTSLSILQFPKAMLPLTVAAVLLASALLPQVHCASSITDDRLLEFSLRAFSNPSQALQPQWTLRSVQQLDPQLHLAAWRLDSHRHLVASAPPLARSLQLPDLRLAHCIDDGCQLQSPRGCLVPASAGLVAPEPCSTSPHQHVWR